MSKSKISLARPIGGSKSTIFNEIPDLPYFERKIRFSLKRCNFDKYCITLLTKKEIERLYKTLGHFEEITWRQIREIPREKGFSIEKKEDSNNKFLLSIKL